MHTPSTHPRFRTDSKTPFKSLEEWDEWANANLRPARDDDTPVLMGQTGPGPRRRATHDELMAFIEEERARFRRKHA